MFGWFKRDKVTKAKRRYQAAVYNRLTADWVADTRSADASIRYDLETLRNRSRNLCENDDYARRYLQLLRSNVIGSSGIMMEMDVRELNGRPDELANNLIEEAWRAFSKSPCTSGKGTLLDLQHLAMDSIARDGEILFRKVKNYGPSNFALQPLEADYLDEDYNVDPDSRGVEIRMGVEIDKYGQPIAYHLRRRHPGDRFASSRVRVAADEIIHVYRRERVGQNRGIPWLATAATGLHHLRQYHQSELVAARINSMKLGFFTSDKESDARFDGDDEDDAGNQILDMSPGSFSELPPGMRVEKFDASNPHSNFDSFTKSILRSVASNLGVSYNSLASDLESVNYSSLRAGALEEREYFKTVQQFLITHMMQPIFESWLIHKLRRGDLNLPVAKADKFNAARFIPRRWSWVDPAKDIAATVDAINNGLKTRGDIIAENYGGSIQDFYARFSREEELRKAAGIEFDENGVMRG